MTQNASTSRIVIVGAGFAGLWAARTLAAQPVDGFVNDEIVPMRTVVWSAGVKGEPLTAMSGIPVADDRIPVEPTLRK